MTACTPGITGFAAAGRLARLAGSAAVALCLLLLPAAKTAAQQPGAAFTLPGWSGGPVQPDSGDPYCAIRSERGGIAAEIRMSAGRSVELSVRHGGWSFPQSHETPSLFVILTTIGAYGQRQSFSVAARPVAADTFVAAIGTAGGDDGLRVLDRLKSDLRLEIDPLGQDAVVLGLEGSQLALQRLEACADGLNAGPPASPPPIDGDHVSRQAPAFTASPISYRVRFDPQAVAGTDLARDLRLERTDLGGSAAVSGCVLGAASAAAGVYDFACPGQAAFACAGPPALRLTLSGFEPLDVPLCDTLTVEAGDLVPSVRICSALSPDRQAPACARTTAQALWGALGQASPEGTLPVEMLLLLASRHPALALAARAAGTDLDGPCRLAGPLTLDDILHAGDGRVDIATTCRVTRIARPEAWPDPAIDRCLVTAAAGTGELLCLHAGPLVPAQADWGAGWMPTSLDAEDGDGRIEAGVGLRPLWPGLAGAQAWAEAGYRITEVRYCRADGIAAPGCCDAFGYDAPQPGDWLDRLPLLPGIRQVCGAATGLPNQVWIRVDRPADSRDPTREPTLYARWRIGDPQPLVLPSPFRPLPLVLRANDAVADLMLGPYWQDPVQLTLFDGPQACRDTPAGGSDPGILRRWPVTYDLFGRELTPRATPALWARLESGTRRLTGCAHADAGPDDTALWFDFTPRYSEAERFAIVLAAGDSLQVLTPELPSVLATTLADWVADQDPAARPVSVYRLDDHDTVTPVLESEELAEPGAQRSDRWAAMGDRLWSRTEFRGDPRTATGLWDVLDSLRGLPVGAILVITDARAEGLDPAQVAAIAAEIRSRGLDLAIATPRDCGDWQRLGLVADGRCVDLRFRDPEDVRSALIRLLEDVGSGDGPAPAADGHPVAAIESGTCDHYDLDRYRDAQTGAFDPDGKLAWTVRDGTPRFGDAAAARPAGTLGANRTLIVVDEAAGRVRVVDYNTDEPVGWVMRADLQCRQTPLQDPATGEEIAAVVTAGTAPAGGVPAFPNPDLTGCAGDCPRLAGQEALFVYAQSGGSLLLARDRVLDTASWEPFVGWVDRTTVTLGPAGGPTIR